MNVTDRDLKTIRFINGHGAATTLQVANYWEVTLTTAARRIRMSVKDGLYEKKSIKGVSYSPLICTAAACKLANDDLAPPLNITKPTLYHDLKVLDVGQALAKKFGGSFEPARRINHHRSTQEKSEHLPDGFLHLPGRRSPVAVELELSAKSQARLKKIFEYYAGKLEIEKVLYLTYDSSVAKLLKRVAHSVQVTHIQIEIL
jgi:hypothetical protein